MVRQDIERGPHRDSDEFVEHAVSLLQDQESWLAEHRAEINAKIEDGYAAARRNDLLKLLTIL